MIKRRKTYIVVTKCTSVKKYELKATTAEEAKQMVRDGWRAGLVYADEVWNVESAHIKDRP